MIKTNVVKRYVCSECGLSGPIRARWDAHLADDHGPLTIYRLLKEGKTYEAEAEGQRKKLAEMQDSGADGADIRNAVILTA